MTAIKVIEAYLRDGVPWTFGIEAHIHSKLTYVGDVSSGLDSIQKQWFKPLIGDTSFYDHGEKFIPLTHPVIATVKCQEMLTIGEPRMRHPVILRLREDKPPEEYIITL